MTDSLGVNVRSLIEQALLVFAALFPIVNPVGGAPVFLAMTEGLSDAERAQLARRIAMNAFLLVLGSIFVGTHVIEFLGLSVPVIRVGGCILVCSVAWDLLRSADAGLPETPLRRATPAEIAARAFYPMTLPLTVGPGSISVAITLGAQVTRGVSEWAIRIVASAVGTLLLTVSIYVLFRYAERLTRAIGSTGTQVLLRLSAFILLCIGVQIVWSGVVALTATVPTFRSP
jgi:multiple antibiotic resistance protein